MSEEYPEFVEPLSPYCLVRAKVASVYADGPDEGSNPDWRPSVDQKVVFTPSISNQLLTYDVGTDDPIIVTVEPVEATTNAEGWFVSNSGERIYLLATDDPRLSATGWTWSVNINRRDIRFSAPSGGVVDLASFIAAPAVDATLQWIERIPSAVDSATAAAEAVAARDTATEQAGLATAARTGAEAARDDAAAYAAGMNVQVGGRNLLLDSDVLNAASTYTIAIYELGDSPPLHNEQVTISIKGTLGEGRRGFVFYNSGGIVFAVPSLDSLSSPVAANPATLGEDGVYRVTGYWQVTKGSTTAPNTHLHVFHTPSNETSTSTIEWIKLERGNRATDWTPAPEDVGVNPDTAQWAAPYSLALELADAAALAASSTIIGVGRPDIPATMTADVATRVAAATSGAVFRSTDGPQGAWEWQKQGGAWDVTVGDTGWRNITPEMPWGQIASGELAIRRTGRTARAWLSVSAFTEGASFGLAPALPAVPHGFAQTRAGARPRLELVDSAAPFASLVCRFYAGRYLYLIGRLKGVEVTASQTLPTSGIWSGVSDSWDTVVAWPTTLPGSPL